MPSAPEASRASSATALAQGAAGVLLANASGAVLALVSQVILARWLGVAAYGLYVYALAWVALLGLVALRGTDTATLRFVAAYAGQGLTGSITCFIAFARRRTLASSIVVAALVAVAAACLGERLAAGGSLAFSLAAGLLLPNTALQLSTSQLVALGRPVLSQVLQGIARPLLLLALLAAWRSFVTQPLAASQALIANALACLAVLAFAASRAQEAVTGVPTDKREVAVARASVDRAQWRAVSSAMLGMALGQALIAQADVLLLGTLAGTAAAGVYAAGARLASLVTFGIVSVNSVLAPRIADLHARQCPEELQASVTHAARLTLAWSVCAVALLLLLARPLLTLFGPEFVTAAPLLLLLGTAQLVLAASGSVGLLLSMTGHQRDALVVVAGGAALTVVLNLALIPRFGAWGAATATLVATAARSIALTLLVRRRLGIRPSALGW